MGDTERDHLCPKCDSEMEIGFLLDNAHVNYLPAMWVKDLPERTFFKMAKIKGKVRREVQTYRCLDCGFLESYAVNEWQGWPKR